MATQTPLDRSHPPGADGARRSTKRDLIVDAFLRHEGHLSADDLVEVIRRDDRQVSRATIYRTLQWMTEAGLARRVDAAEGVVRFEHSYRHPPHFHLICKSCSRSFEFLSHDIEVLVEEIAASRGFAARQSVVQVHGTCERCRGGQPLAVEEGDESVVLARDALRVAMATQRGGREFYARAARLARGALRAVFTRMADETMARLTALEERYRALLGRDPQLDARPAVLFFRDADHGLFASGSAELATAVDDQRTLMVAVRCERGAQAFFDRYAARLEGAEVRRLFVELAAEQRRHVAQLLEALEHLPAGRGRTAAPSREARGPA